MKPKQFLQAVENKKILEAIRAAEEGSTSDIVVLISPKEIPQALPAAEKAFAQLRLGKAVHQNSLLIFVSPRSQTFAVVGGPALHAKVGDAWWKALADLLGDHFKNGRFSEGLLSALDIAGRAVKEHFPATTPENRSGQHDLLEE